MELILPMEQMDYIYTYLGNGINHELTKQFVRSGFDRSIIEKIATTTELWGGNRN